MLFPPCTFSQRACLLIGLLAPLFPVHAEAAEEQPRHHLMPIPAAIKFQPGRLRLDSGFTVGVCDTTGPRAQRGIERALHRLAERTGLTISRAWAKESAAMLFVCAKGAGEKVQDPEEDETYSLRVSAGRAELRANTEVGVLRGLETFL